MTLYNLLKKNEVPYCRKEVVKLLYKIKYAKNEELRQKYNEQLFFALGRIVLKNINSFFSYVKSKGVLEEKILHSPDDLATESYLVLVNCTKNVNLKYRDSFHFFYNTSLLRRNKRIFERQYQKHLGVLRNTDKVEYVLQNKNAKSDNINFDEIDLSSFSQLEVDLIKSKVDKESITNFAARTEITNEDYKVLLNRIKSKLKKIYEYDAE